MLMFKVYNLQQQQHWTLYYYAILISCWNVWSPSAYVNSSALGKAFTCSWLKGHAVFGTVSESTELDNDSGSGPSQSMP